MQSSPHTPKQPETKNEADESSLSVNEFNSELMYRNTVLYGIKIKQIPTPSTHPDHVRMSPQQWACVGSQRDQVQR